MKRILLSLFFALVAVASWAYDVEIDGIYYNLVSKAKTAAVTSGDAKYTGDIVIPSSIDFEGVTYSVTSIGESAFYICISLTSITIPNSVTSIGNNAFSRCYSLTSITIPNSVTNISEKAFNSCSSLTSITIPNSVTSIGNSAFFGCYSLTSITIPNSVTSIGDDAFYNCM